MTIEKAGNGQQVGSANPGEVNLGVMNVPATATSTATLTAAQVLGKILVGDPSGTAATYTLPTVATLEAALPGKKVGTTFDLAIINLGTSTGIITLAVGTGWTITGMLTLPIMASAGSSGLFRARKTDIGAWTLYRVG